LAAIIVPLKKDQTAPFSFFPALNFTTLDALIFIASQFEGYNIFELSVDLSKNR